MQGLRPRRELACAAGIVLLAAWLRLRHLGLAEFKSDEAIALRIAHDILEGNVRTVGLTSSSGAANPPLYVYIVAAVVGIHDSPLFATGSVAVLAVVAIALTYVVVRPRFGGMVALVASALFATAPWAVLYGRHLWQQDYLPVVTVLLLWSLFAVLERPRTRAAFLVPVLGSVAVQLNLSAVALAVPIVALLVYRARSVHRSALVLGVVAGLLLLAPWLAHNAKHGFHDFSLIADNGRGHGGAAGTGTIEAIRQTVNLVSAEGWGFVVGSQHQPGAADTVGRIAGIATVVLLGVGMLTAAVAVVRDVRRRGALGPDAARRGLLLVWLLGIWASYLGSSRSGVGPHYLIVSYPVTFVLAALGLVDLARPARAVPVAPVAAALVGAGFLAFTVSFQHLVQRQGGTAGDYGVVYRDTAALADAARVRGLHVDDAAAEYLITGHLTLPPGTRAVPTRNRLRDATPLPCAGLRRSFGPLEACFPK
ncbi:MAG TPA: glycosyltransferase family 39 protein [Gaiellaceae bacterium]|nr:glycosyltransferase family 39 protein [Gaiellaceae bacterium]